MSRELDLLAKEFNKIPVTVIRTEVNLYGAKIQVASSSFIRKIESTSKLCKNPKVTLIAVITEM
jgi:hypothetical protein